MQTEIVVTYAMYLILSIALTIWVARTLFKNGRIFLVDVFRGNEAIADSVNQLLVVGFYLINLGYISLMLKIRRARRRCPPKHRGACLQDGPGAAGPWRDALFQPVSVQQDSDVGPEQPKAHAHWRGPDAGLYAVSMRGRKEALP